MLEEDENKPSQLVTINDWGANKPKSVKNKKKLYANQIRVLQDGNTLVEIGEALFEQFSM